MLKESRIGVVIPAFNEEALICKTLSSLPSVVDEVIVVDDCSQDKTCTKIRKFSSPIPISLVCHTQNRGVGAAISTGYKVALSLGCQVVVVMGADAQMDPENMIRLIEPVRRGECDYAKGNRFAWPDAKTVIPKVRFWGGYMLSFLTRMASGYSDIVDSQCGYTAIHRDVLLKLPLDELYPRYGYPNDLLVHLGTIGARLRQVPVRPIYADERSDLKIRKVIFTISFLLVRSGIRRRWITLRGRQTASSKIMDFSQIDPVERMIPSKRMAQL